MNAQTTGSRFGLVLALALMATLAGAARAQETMSAEDALTGSSDIEDWITRWTGSPIYPSQHGIPGWPGYLKGDPVRGDLWGFPERTAYPGSVEHYRVELQRYVPPVPLFNARTLVKNFLATELPGVAKDRVVDFAEPVYYVPKYPTAEYDALNTGLKNKPVKTLRWDKSHPPIELDLGTLAPSIYVVRAIAATDTAHVERSSKRLVIHCEVNDGPGGEVSHYVKRVAALDEFYGVVEFYFMAPTSRGYKAKLWIDDSTVLPVLYLYNVDLHNKLAQLPQRAGKKSPTYYTAAARLADWRAKGTFQADERSKEQRLADDAALWAGFMPINAQPLLGFNEATDMLLRSAFPLLEPGQADKDDGMGIDFYGDQVLWKRSPEFLQKHAGDWTVDRMLRNGPKLGLTRHTAYPKAYALNELYAKPYSAVTLAKKYHTTGDQATARAAAINLARLGLQFTTSGNRQGMFVYDTIPQLVHGDVAFRRRYKEMDYQYRGTWEINGVINSYDHLFPYIQENSQELAESLGRFIPWVKTPADVQRFYDTFILQYYGHLVMNYNAYEDNTSAAWITNVIAVQQDPQITAPWVQWLFRYVWVYPERPMGLDEIAVNSINREGTDKKGSVYYTSEGSFLSEVVESLTLYKRGGGSLPLDFTDVSQFPKAVWGPRFKNDIMVAQGYTFWIGDVSGPSRPRLHRRQEFQDNPGQVPDNRSRVLASWAGILETGHESQDFRDRRALGVRVGPLGFGHAHTDPLDLQIWAHGVPICGDGGGRSGYAAPDNGALESHNTVISPLATQSNYSWITSFAPTAGAQYLAAQVQGPDLYARQVVLVDVDEPGAAPAGGTPNSYVVDFFRVKGGELPAYAFHGPPNDAFEVNVGNRQKGTFGGFAAVESRWTGTAADPLVATWRMRREPGAVSFVNANGEKREYNVPGAERMAMGAGFDEKAPQKSVRMHLLGHGGATAYGAMAACMEGETFSNDNLYVNPRDWKGSAIFPVVLEPYAGQTFIKSVKLLTPAAVSDATAPVAIEVTLNSGRRDVIYAAPREAGPTNIEGLGTFHGEYAFVSFLPSGEIRQAVLVGGTQLQVGKLKIAAEQPAYTGTIKSVDYFARKAELSAALPAQAKDAVIEVGPDQRRTSYTLQDVAGERVTFLKGMDLAMTRLQGADKDGVTLQRNIPLAVGATVTDEHYKNFWRTVGPIDENRALKLTAGPDPASALKGGDVLRSWEFGPGDSYRLPVQINVRRGPDGKYQTTANAKASVSTP